MNKRDYLLIAAGAGAGIAAWRLATHRRELDLCGRTALITGSSRGLGLVLARQLAAEGCRVVICARGEPALEAARADLEARGADVFAQRCDVSRRDEVEALVSASRDRFGDIDILINNAGVIQAGPVGNMTVEDFENAMDVMFWGVVYPTLAVLPGMLARREGRIVNITSIGGKLSMPHLLPYGSAKFAAAGFSEGLRAELKGKGIYVTTIVPGLMRTGSYGNAWFKGQAERELVWFGLSDSLPGISMNAERAARQIVKAMRRGEAERVLSLPAILAARFHGLFPGFTSDLLALANRVLPGAVPGGEEQVRGREAQRRVSSRWLNAATRLSRRAAKRNNEGGFAGDTV